MAPSWIHCCLCYNLMMKKEHEFYHLSCHHILCRRCMAKTKRGTVCPVCQGSLRRFVELNNEMERKYKMWYEPSAVKTFNLACQTLLFQQKHRKHLMQQIVQVRKSLPRLNELEAQLRGNVSEMQRRLEKLRSFRRSLQENLRRSRPPTASWTIQSSGRSLKTPSYSLQPSGEIRFPIRRMSTESLQESLRRSRPPTASGSIQSSGMSMKTPAFSLQSSGQLQGPMRRMSTDSAFSSVQYAMQPQGSTTFNGSFGMQQFGSGKICHRRLSNDSGIGTITPHNASFNGSADRVRFNTRNNTFFRSTFISNICN